MGEQGRTVTSGQRNAEQSLREVLFQSLSTMTYPPTEEMLKPTAPVTIDNDRGYTCAFEAESGAAPSQEGKVNRLHSKVSRFAKSKTRILKDWFVSHSTHPYPTELEKEMLEEQTGLTVRQISHWFVNARRRGNFRTAANLSMSLSPTSFEFAAPQYSSLPEPWQEMSPLDRWRHSPPDEEPAPLDAIAHAVEGVASSLPNNGVNYKNPFATTVSSFEAFDTASFAHSSGLSSSNSSRSSFRSNNRQRRRRQYTKSHKASRKKGEDLKFQCTFCTDKFKSKYDWTRHEGTLHLVLEKWTCVAFGPTYPSLDGEVTNCTFCDAANPSDSHIQSHGYSECKEKPPRARTFYRKDHLRQHLRSVHDVHQVLPSMSNWKTKTTRLNSRCGFCGERFQLWSARNDHLADHFREGSRMKDWKGCRGLDPAVALLVENAMPLYLIGVEAEELEPFSAAKTLKAAEAGIDLPAAPTLFETLTTRLSSYVADTKRKGIILTDDVLRNEARLIIFGDEDPWNQTPADNGQWLALFKKGHGLDFEPVAPGKFLQHGPTEWDQLCPTAEEYLTQFLPGSIQNGASSSMDAAFQFYTGLTHEYAENNIDPSNPPVPLAWQTPECLAEFRELGHLAPPENFNAFVPEIEAPRSSPCQFCHCSETDKIKYGDDGTQPFYIDSPLKAADAMWSADDEVMFPFDLDLVEHGIGP